jgi:hypothetical protein
MEAERGWFPLASSLNAARLTDSVLTLSVVCLTVEAALCAQTNPHQIHILYVKIGFFLKRMVGRSVSILETLSLRFSLHVLDMHGLGISKKYT